MSDHRIDFDFALHIAIDIARKLRPAFHTTESAAPPDSPGNQLKWPCTDLLSGSGDADDHRLAPTLMTALQRCPHGCDIADAFERIVHASVRHVDNYLLDRCTVRFRRNEICRAKALSHSKFLLIGVDRYDAFRSCEHETL